MENNDMIGAVEEYVLQNTKKRMNAGELKAERIEEHDMLNWVKANRKALNAGKMKPERVEKFRKLQEMTEQYRRKNNGRAEYKHEVLLGR